MEKIDIEELKELFIEIKYGNSIGFEKLYNKYKKLVYGIAFSILKNKQDSEDIVQIVFTKIYSIDKSKLPTTNEASWLYSVTKNETINYIKNKHNDINLDSIYEIECDNTDINKIIEQDSYNRLISRLNDKEKEIVSLKILSNLSFEEIGKVLNVPTGTIKWRYYKSVHTLRLLLSNLSMFIISFITSIIAFKNSPKSSQDLNLEVQENIISGTPSLDKDKTEESKKEENIIQEDNNSQTQENIIVEIPHINNTNYVGMSFLGISSFFLITTIIFLIIFAKYQLKRKKKLSK